MKKKHNKKKTVRNFFSSTLLVLLVLGTLVSMGGFAYLDKYADNDIEYEADELNSTLLSRNIINYDGKRYKERSDITTCLMIGNDKSDEASVNEELLEEGYICKMADMQMLLVIDEKDKSYCMLQLDRNTITAIPMLYADGEEAEERDMQLCTAYFYGHDEQSASENVVTAVSRFLKGTKIDKYISIPMKGIKNINRAVGGVTVTIEDDFSVAYPETNMLPGETIKLTDRQAKIFVQNRMNIGDGSNVGRLRRQRAYMQGLKTSFVEGAENDANFIDNFYNELSEVMTSNGNTKELAGITGKLVDYEDKGIVTIDGEVTFGYHGGDGIEHEEFIPDEDSVMETVLELFYTEMREN